MFEQKSAKETILELHSSAGNGLSEAEARKRLEQNGKNELKEGKKKSVAEAFFEQLNDPLIYVLLVAVIISLLLHEVSDAMIILVVVTVNAVVGVIQEGKAQKALEALKGLTIPKAIVKREGRKGRFYPQNWLWVILYTWMREGRFRRSSSAGNRQHEGGRVCINRGVTSGGKGCFVSGKSNMSGR